MTLQTPPHHRNSTAASVSLRTTFIADYSVISNNKKGHNNNDKNNNDNVKNNYCNKRASI